MIEVFFEIEIETFIEIQSSAEWQKVTGTPYVYDLVQLLVMFRFHLAASAASSCCLVASSWAARNRSFASAISFAASSFPPAQPDNRECPYDLSCCGAGAAIIKSPPGAGTIITNYGSGSLLFYPRLEKIL